MKKALLLSLPLALAAFAAGHVAGRRSVVPGLLDAARPAGPSVATFRGGAVGRADVEALLARHPEAFRAQLRSPEARKALVQDLVRRELLAREAERRGLQRDPEFLRRYEEELARALLEKEVDAPQRDAEPTDAELRAFYDEHRASLARPERVRLAAVSWLAPAGDAARRREKRARADAALGRLRGSKDPFLFGDLVRTESEDAEARRTAGELPPLTREELAQRLGAEVATAAFGDEAPTGVLPRVVETAGGVHVVKLLGREAGYAPALEEVRDAIRARLVSERRAAARAAFLERIWKDAAVSLDTQAIERLSVP
ncbi:MULTISPECIES: peptidylprolyl isomerase [Anaeromyxobacter]|uniref:peptidylprolyl isomerase n=1 Tax=Anaeromyxobacter TaxID=161492 RepID=UPI0027E056D0|nr:MULTISPECIES: peptidylprolyl isomerase [unclassified Anaeromyxobacter]